LRKEAYDKGMSDLGQDIDLVHYVINLLELNDFSFL